MDEYKQEEEDLSPTISYHKKEAAP